MKKNITLMVGVIALGSLLCLKAQATGGSSSGNTCWKNSDTSVSCNSTYTTNTTTCTLKINGAKKSQVYSVLGNSVSGLVDTQDLLDQCIYLCNEVETAPPSQAGHSTSGSKTCSGTGAPTS